jgi:hypothetical protein
LGKGFVERAARRTQPWRSCRSAIFPQDRASVVCQVAEHRTEDDDKPKGDCHYGDGDNRGGDSGDEVDSIEIRAEPIARHQGSVAGEGCAVSAADSIGGGGVSTADAAADCVGIGLAASLDTADSVAVGDELGLDVAVGVGSSSGGLLPCRHSQTRAVSPEKCIAAATVRPK